MLENALVTSPAIWRLMDRVEVRFEGSKGSHADTVVSRVKATSGCTSIDWGWKELHNSGGGQGGVGDSEAMLELMSMHVLSGESASNATCAEGPRWRVWTKKQASAALRAREDRRPWPRRAPATLGRIGGAAGLASIAWGCRRTIFGSKGGGRSGAVGMYERASR